MKEWIERMEWKEMNGRKGGIEGKEGIERREK